MASTSQVNPRAQTSASQPQPSAANGSTKGPTKWNVVFTPGGSSVIKDNLIRVYENREYRIYGAYLTGVTALRSGLEILPSVGILLLNTTTWFVDVTSPRGDGPAIFARDLGDVLHCIKTTIALPFFALAGLIFPADVFGLFENMPGIQTKVEILDEKAALANVKKRRAFEELNLDAAEKELAGVQKELKETDDALTATKAQLEAVQKQIEGSKEAAAEAARLTTQVGELKETAAKLRVDEGAVSSTLTRIRDDIARLGSDLEAAKAGNTFTLQSLERERTAKQEELKRIQDQIKQTGEKQAASKAEFDRLSAVIKDLSPRAAALVADVERLETAKPGLLTQEKDLLAKIQSHKDELAGLERQVADAKESTRVALEGLKKQIAAQQTVIDQRAATIDRLGSEQKEIEGKRKELLEKCNTLEFTTLGGLNGRRETLEKAIKSLDEQRTDLGSEIAAQQEVLRAEKETAKTLAARVHELNTTIDELKRGEAHFKDTVLPGLESQAKSLEERNVALQKEVSAEEQTLERVRTTQADIRRELESVTTTLASKRAEQANLERAVQSIQAALKGVPANNAAADGSASAEETVAALRRELQALGTSISEQSQRDTELKALLANEEAALREKTQTASRLTSDAASLGKKIEGLQGQDRELNTRLSSLGAEIKKLEGKETVLKERNAALERQVQEKSAALERIDSDHKALEEQVTKTKETKDRAIGELKTLGEQVAAAKRERGEIQGEIDGLKPSIESMQSTLATLGKEKEKLDTALQPLRIEEQSLTRQIADGKLELAQLKETSARAQEAHTAEMRTLEEARTRLTEEKGRLESENATKRAARDALQSEFDRLTASTEALRGQETTLKDTVRAAEQAQQAAIARTAEERAASEALKAQAQASAAQVGTLAQQKTELIEGNQRLDAEFATRRAAFEEELRQRDLAAVDALESKLQEIRLRSPAKAKLDSPARSTSSSVPPTPGTAAEDLTTVLAKIKQKTRELERADAAIKERRVELEDIKQETTAYTEQLQAKLATTKEELARVNAEKEKAELILAATMNKTEYDALIASHTQELQKLRIDRARIEAQVKTLRQERDGALAVVAATPARKAGARNDTPRK